jgi:hypothetical protein
MPSDVLDGWHNVVSQSFFTFVYFDS